MSSYRYTLRDYHAVKEADLALDGITVLTGINGCGKSTLSRWLSYIVNGLEEYNQMAYVDLLGELESIVERLLRISLLFDLSNRHGLRRAAAEAKTYIQHRKEQGYTEESLSEADSMMAKLLDEAHTILSSFLSNEQHRLATRRLLLSMGLPPSERTHPLEALEHFIEENRRTAEHAGKVCARRINNRRMEDFQRLLSATYAVGDDCPAHLTLAEDGLGVYPADEDGKRVGTPFRLRRAIYVDTPMAVARDGTSEHWKRLRACMMHEDKAHRPCPEQQQLIDLLERLLRGGIKVSKKKLTDTKELRYERQDGLSIPLADAATGFKSLAYLYRLLTNGMLDDQTILIIDEPEAHLHPQWIAEVAYLLVMIHKVTGTKLMLTTHNPHLMIALKEIALKEEIINRTRFYLAQAEQDGLTYTYGDIAQDIEPVFEAFNMVYDRIEHYAGTDMD